MQNVNCLCQIIRCSRETKFTLFVKYVFTSCYFQTLNNCIYEAAKFVYHLCRCGSPFEMSLAAYHYEKKARDDGRYLLLLLARVINKIAVTISLKRNSYNTCDQNEFFSAFKCLYTSRSSFISVIYSGYQNYPTSG